MKTFRIGLNDINLHNIAIVTYVTPASLLSCYEFTVTFSGGTEYVYRDDEKTCNKIRAELIKAINSGEIEQFRQYLSDTMNRLLLGEEGADDDAERIIAGRYAQLKEVSQEFEKYFLNPQ